jgi:polysaccharide biosynthesis/export protein
MKNCLYIVLLFALISCKNQNLLVQTKSDAKKMQPLADSVFQYNADYQYQIRQDDKISISVWGQDEVSVGSSYGIYNSNEVYGKWLMVDAKGQIELPKIGSFEVLGKTVIELKDSLKKIFSGWIVNPIVDVKILNKQITLLGELKNPGVITVDKERNNLLDMVGRAGGFEFYANLKKVKVLRQHGTDVWVTNIDLTQDKNYTTQNLALEPGDVVIVPSKKYKTFDKRISTIIPFTTAISAAAIVFGLF